MTSAAHIYETVHTVIYGSNGTNSYFCDVRVLYRRDCARRENVISRDKNRGDREVDYFLGQIALLGAWITSFLRIFIRLRRVILYNALYLVINTPEIGGGVWRSEASLARADVAHAEFPICEPGGNEISHFLRDIVEKCIGMRANSITHSAN